MRRTASRQSSSISTHGCHRSITTRSTHESPAGRTARQAARTRRRRRHARRSERRTAGARSPRPMRALAGAGRGAADSGAKRCPLRRWARRPGRARTSRLRGHANDPRHLGPEDVDNRRAIRRVFDQDRVRLRIPPVQFEHLPTGVVERPLSLAAIDQIDVGTLARGLQADHIVTRRTVLEGHIPRLEPGVDRRQLVIRLEPFAAEQEPPGGAGRCSYWPA